MNNTRITANSIKALNNDEISDLLTNNRAKYSMEYIFKAAQEAQNRNIVLPQSLIDILQSTQENKGWFYEKKNNSIGPVTLNRLLSLYNRNQISYHTKVWIQGFSNWMELCKTNLIIKINTNPKITPPPLNPPAEDTKEVTDNVVWAIVFLPLLLVIISVAIDSRAFGFAAILYFLILTVNCILLITDILLIKKAGYEYKKLILWVIFLVPVYLFERANLIDKKYDYAITYLVIIAIVLIWSTIGIIGFRYLELIF